MTHYEIVKKLIGRVRPCSDSGIDAERLENLKALIELTTLLVVEINDLKEFASSYEHSVSEIGKEAKNAIEIFGEIINNE